MARTTYEKLQRQIATLQAQAEKLRRKEVDEVIVRMRAAIEFYGISAQELGFTDGAAPGSRRKVAGSRREDAQAAGKPARGGARGGKGRRDNATPEVRYRDENGNVWVGRGKRPQWLRDALAGGRTLDEFRVAPG